MGTEPSCGLGALQGFNYFAGNVNVPGDCKQYVRVADGVFCESERPRCWRNVHDADEYTGECRRNLAAVSLAVAGGPFVREAVFNRRSKQLLQLVQVEGIVPPSPFQGSISQGHGRTLGSSRGREVVRSIERLLGLRSVPSERTESDFVGIRRRLANNPGPLLSVATRCPSDPATLPKRRFPKRTNLGEVITHS